MGGGNIGTGGGGHLVTQWSCDGFVMGGERREGLCDMAWMCPLPRYQGSAGATVALHSCKHEKCAQGMFKVRVSRPPDKISAISNIYENFKQCAYY